MTEEFDVSRNFPHGSPQAKQLEGFDPIPDERARAYVDAGYWRNLRFHDIVDHHAQHQGDVIAAIDHQREVSYSELRARSERIAAGLLELGFEHLDRVLFQISNRLEFLEGLIACSRIGVIPVMLLPRHRYQEVAHVAEITEAVGMVTIASERGFDFIELAEDVHDEVDSLSHRIAIADQHDLPEEWVKFSDLNQGDQQLIPERSRRVNPFDPGFFLLSGGTTGLPKVIPRTHNDHIYQWEWFAREMKIKSGWTGFICLPAAHNAPLVSTIGTGLWRGNTLAFEPNLKVEPLMELIARVGGNWSLPMTAQLVDILDHPDIDSFDLSSLELLISGGQKVPPQLAYDVEEALDIEFINLFGMTEGPLIGTRPGDDPEQKAHTIGYPLVPHADEVKLVQLSDRSSEVSRGERGELAVRGPGCFSGYFRNSKENAEGFDDEGWFYAEDILRQRDDGYYEVMGRLKDMIIRGGENILAPGIEGELANHPSIQHAALVGKPDDRLGERPYAFIELVEDAEEPVTVESLSKWLSDRGVAVFKHPEFIEIVNELPRTGAEKINKAPLREQLR